MNPVIGIAMWVALGGALFALYGLLYPLPVRHYDDDCDPHDGREGGRP